MTQTAVAERDDDQMRYVGALVTPEHIEYLDKLAARRGGASRAAIIRQLIDNAMRSYEISDDILFK